MYFRILKISLLFLFVFNTILFSQSAINLNLLVRFNDVLNTSNYRMIGLPGNSQFHLSSLLDGTSGRDWIAFYDDGTGKLVPHTDGMDDEFIFSTGKAYWILSKDNFRVQNLNAPYSETINGRVRIPLHSGWNMITNPFDTSISWEVIKSINNINDRIYYFKDGRYTSSSLNLEPYLGYYFFNRFDKEYLEIPENDNVTISKSAISESHRTISVRLYSEGKILTEYKVYLTNSPELAEVLTQYAPPDNFAEISVFSKDDITGYKTSANGILNSGKITLPLYIKNKLDDVNVTITSESRNYSARILDNYGFEVERIKNTDNYQNFTLSIYDNTTSGNFEYPDIFQISPAYPNPFNPSAKIRVSLPEASTISLSVYDITGTEVYKNRYEYSSPGYYDINLNLGNHSSGVYFYKLTYKNKVYSDKLILLK